MCCNMQTSAAGVNTLPDQFSDLPSYSVTFPKGTKSQTTFGIIRDHDGLMWISTSNGIERYDGMSFKNYSLGRTKIRRIRDGFQATIYMDPEGNIYTFTERSLVFRYNHDKDEFEQIVSLKIQPYLHSVKAMVAEGEILHLGTSSGIRVFDILQDSIIDVSMRTKTFTRFCLMSTVLISMAQATWWVFTILVSAMLACFATSTRM